MNFQIPSFLRSRAFAIVSLLLLLIIMEAVFLTAEYRLSGEFGFSSDDSWIHATFARNLAEGQGFCFNLGEPVSGSIAPLFTLLLAAWFAIFGEIIWGAKLLSIIGLGIACVFLYLATERLTEERFVAWLSAALCLASPPLLWSSLSGMEVAVYIITPCAALYFFTRQHYRWMTVALALGVWLRPEAGLLLALGWLAIPARHKLSSLSLGAAILLPYFAFNFWLSGYPFPATVRAKAVWSSAHFTFKFLEDAIPLFSYAHFFPIFLVFPWGFRALWKKAWWVALFPPLFFLWYWGNSATPAVGGRWLWPMFPFLYLTIAFSVAWFVQKKPASSRYVKSLAFILVAIQFYVCTNERVTHGLSVQNITDMQISIAKVIPRITAPSDTIATNDIGALGYFSERYILDLVGLVSPLRTFEENLRLFQPAMLVIFDSWFPERLVSPTFLDHYNLLGKVGLAQNVVCGDNVMSLYAHKDCFDDILARIGEAEFGK